MVKGFYVCTIVEMNCPKFARPELLTGGFKAMLET
jgi:hypothetical protein